MSGLAPRLDVGGERVRDAIRAGVRIVCSTDAHSVRGLEHMELAVRIARRGWAMAGDVVVNIGPLASILGSCREVAAQRRWRAARRRPRC